MEKILIANRGEIALRVIKSCQKKKIKTVAIYSEADSDLPYVKAADEAYCIGKPPVSQSYLNGEEIIKLAKRVKADAIHPGYGLLSENHDFAAQVIEAGITFIGPHPETIAMMGDKIAARNVMKQSGVPVVPGSEEALNSVEDAITLSSKIGYPVMLKASGGGGGIGMVLCESEEDVSKHFHSVKSRAKAYFGSEHVFIEKYIQNARHIEVQILADSHGNAVHLFERDCSIQRRNQKVIEETHSPSISAETREKMYAASIRAAKATNYVNAGTIEYIVDEDENFYFLEMNTRLQVEHPVTEMVTGLDLVEWQIRIANGEKLVFTQADIEHKGHAIEFRVYAENPDNFYPSPGTIEELSWGEGNVRIDSGYESGNTVTPYYDPLIAKCIIYGTSRMDCISTAKNFFATTRLTGLKTNIPLFQKIVENDQFQEGHYYTNFIQILRGGKK